LFRSRTVESRSATDGLRHPRHRLFEVVQPDLDRDQRLGSRICKRGKGHLAEDRIELFVRRDGQNASASTADESPNLFDFLARRIALDPIIHGAEQGCCKFRRNWKSGRRRDEESHWTSTETVVM